MKKALLFLLFLFINLHIAHAAEYAPADTYLTGALNEVISTLKNDPDLLRNHEQMDAYVANQIFPKFDMALLSKSIVGETLWEAASAEDRAGLTDELTLFFKHLFSKTLAEYDGQTIALNEVITSPNGKNVIVKGNLFDPKDETIAISFRMSQAPTGWKIYDVSLGGVDLIYTYKSNFKSILENGGIVQLTSELHKKNQLVSSSKS